MPKPVNRNHAALLTIALAGALTLMSRPAPTASQEYRYTDGDSLHPRVQYRDGSVSLNDRCAVRMTKLAKSMRPVYVNGQPIGFC